MGRDKVIPIAPTHTMCDGGIMRVRAKQYVLIKPVTEVY